MASKKIAWRGLMLNKTQAYGVIQGYIRNGYAAMKRESYAKASSYFLSAIELERVVNNYRGKDDPKLHEAFQKALSLAYPSK